MKCPADTATVKYSLAADSAIAGNTITCDKSTGKYTPMFLSPCELNEAFTSGFKEQLYPIFYGTKVHFHLLFHLMITADKIKIVNYIILINIV